MDEEQLDPVDKGRDRLNSLSVTVAALYFGGATQNTLRQVMYTVKDVEDGVEDEFFISLAGYSNDQLMAAIRRAMENEPFESKYRYVAAIRVALGSAQD